MARVYSYRVALETWLLQRRIPPVLFYYIVVNVLVYLIAGLFTVGSQLVTLGTHSSFFYNLALPSNLEALIQRPWTLLTHFFYHQSFIHLLFNMLWLWVFGRMFFEYFTARHFHIIYWLGGLAGGVAYLWAYNFFGYFSTLVAMSVAMGASASIMAITLATVIAAPNNVVYLFGFLRIRIVWLVLAMVLLDFLSVTQANAGGHIAHLGGALAGALYAYFTLHSHAAPQSPLQRFAVKCRALWAKVLTIKRKKKSQTTKTNAAQSAKEDEKEIERILAKLAKGGYASLSSAEKEKLFRRR